MRASWRSRLLLVIPLGFLCLAGCGESPGDRDDGGAGDGQATAADGLQADLPGCANPQTYYPDEDGDGWGSELAEPVQSCTQPAGHVTNKVDCADGDDDAHPGQQSFFDQPIEGRAGNEWDYNCDGMAEPEDLYPGPILCENRGYTICETNFEPSWWGTKVPACGETAKVVTSCTLIGGALNFTCDANTSDERVQGCR